MAISDPEVLYRSMRGLDRERARLYAPHINAAMLRGEITTLRRAQYFIAQLAHESVDLRYFEEIASGAAYEGRRDLGNTQPGDGRRFKGRGPIQLTGRSNYRGFGIWLGEGEKFTREPSLVATPKYGFLAALYYWQTRNLNGYCDRGDFRGLTRRINGGYNGLADRYLKLAYVKRLGSKILPAKPDPRAVLGREEREAVEGLEKERRYAHKNGEWRPAGQARAEAHKARVREYIKALEAATERDRKAGMSRSDARSRRHRSARHKLLSDAYRD
jgi:predicted chitinase